jgi:hypothetical protein
MLDPIVFEHLVSLNHNVAAAIDILKKLAEFKELQTDDFQATASYFREHLSNANVSILEALHESEERAGGKAYQERRAYEKELRDPDDCYVEVMRREKERQQQGLPSLIGIQYEMRSAHVGDLPEVTAETENDDDDDSDSEGNPDNDADDATADSESARRGELRRQKIIARVEELRTAQRMTKQEFHTQIGVSEARSWRSFVGSDADEAWKRVTPQMFEKIAHLFGIDSADLLK